MSISGYAPLPNGSYLAPNATPYPLYGEGRRLKGFEVDLMIPEVPFGTQRLHFVESDAKPTGYEKHITLHFATRDFWVAQTSGGQPDDCPDIARAADDGMLPMRHGAEA